MALSPTQQSLNMCSVLSESRRIINAHSRHFLALSVLFLLPISFSITIFPTLQTLLSHSTSHVSLTLLSLPTHDKSLETKTIVGFGVFSLILVLCSLLATGSITYSVVHGFYGRPVKLVSAIKSGLVCFFKLLVSEIVIESSVLLIIVVSGSVLFLIMKGIEVLGVEIEANSLPLLVLLGLYGMGVLLILVFLKVRWCLMSVVVVVESNWGFNALKRSGYLIEGMRGVALCLLMFFGLFAGSAAFAGSDLVVRLGIIDNSEGWHSWGFVLQIVLNSTILTVFLLYSIAANTVLYMYCKALHGELAFEIAEEFAREYVCLPFDDGKAPHVVSIVYA